MDRMLKYCDNSNYLEIKRLSFGISNKCMLLWAKAAVCVIVSRSAACLSDKVRKEIFYMYGECMCIHIQLYNTKFINDW